MGNELSGQGKERTVIRRDRLRELRNRIDFRHLFRRLGWPWKAREDGVILFVCPECSEKLTQFFLTGVSELAGNPNVLVLVTGALAAKWLFLWYLYRQRIFLRL